MRRALLLLAGLMILAGSAYGQDTPIGDFSTNYSYFKAVGHGGANLHGGNVSGAVNVNSCFGVAGDYGIYHFQPSFSGGINIHTFTVGPRVSLRGSHVTPFGQVLVGGFHGLGTNGFALSAGGGVDIKISRLLAIRMAQVEYMMLRSQGDTLNCARVSAGIVFRFGGR